MIPPASCPGPQGLSRRRMLQIGGASLMNLSLSGLLRADARRAEKPAADACIIIFLNGGPSHLDMWDMKPAAPREIRGEFQPIATTVPGVQLSEHLPRLAKHMHRCSLVRSVHHTVFDNHAAGVYTSLTGHDRGVPGGLITAGPNDYPAIGAVMAKCRPPATAILPFVSMPYKTLEGAGGPPQPGFFGGWLGRTYDPLFMLRDPNSPTFGMPELAPPTGVTVERLQDRRALANGVGAGLGNWQADRKLQDMDGFTARAFDLLSAAATQRAFQIEREPAAVREAYGRNIYGQSVLLARRLIEAGSRVASISWAPDANATWDTHGANFAKLKNELLPQFDMAISSLLTDLAERGMLERTVVAVMGEWGRTPKINANAGRDHYNFCYSLMLAGGGIRGGHVHGSSDKIGAKPSTQPVTPADIIATIYQCLGLPADLELHDRLQRPFSLVPWGSPIRELLV